MQAITNKQNMLNIDLQSNQQQVSGNAELKQCHVDDAKCYVCSFGDCNDRFLHLYSLNDHIAKHKGKQKHECNTCEKKFFSLKKLREHKETHGYFSPYACSICKKTFANNDGLIAHNRSEKHKKTVSLEANKYTCDICPKTFALRREQEHHYSFEHKGYQPYKCTVCDNRFVSQGAQKRHYKTIHEGKTIAECKQIKSYQCEICTITFPRLDKLEEHHKQQHPGKKPYICHICNKGFSYSKTKVKHYKEVIYRTLREKHYKNRAVYS